MYSPLDFNNKNLNRHSKKKFDTLRNKKNFRLRSTISFLFYFKFSRLTLNKIGGNNLICFYEHEINVDKMVRNLKFKSKTNIYY